MRNGRAAAAKVPGSIYDNNGHWYWRARLPGDARRVARPLKMPGSAHAMPSTKDRRFAEEAAMRIWEDANHVGRGGPAGVVVDELCDRYLAHAAVYYRHRDGTPTGRIAEVRCSLRLLREMFGPRYVSDLTHADMLAHRDALVRSGIARQTLNSRVRTVRQMMEWALDEGLVPAVVKAELSQVRPYKPFRSPCRETQPIRAVADAVVDATVAAMVPNTADMVRVHRLTGMRPQEVCDLAWDCIDTSAEPWVYRPPRNKNECRNQPRVVCIGPRAREILNRHRDGLRPFSPKLATLEAMAAKRAAATCPSTRDRRDPDAQRVPREKWERHEYTRTIQAAAARAGQPRWSANQLRHALATEVRRKFGLEAARAVLGHSGGTCRITDRYSWEAAEDEFVRIASPAVEALG